MTRVGLVSLGCAKNRVDAERILGGLRDRAQVVHLDPLRRHEVHMVPMPARVFFKYPYARRKPIPDQFPPASAAGWLLHDRSQESD